MTTEKQVEANRQNAQLSTGPVTAIGKTTIATNAIKHGIFTKDLILKSEIGQESEDEYKELLNNLIDSLLPYNQMESLLVEKIAVDFWRLRRTIRFETGSLNQHIKSLLNQFYSHGNQNNEKIDEEIKCKEQTIAWNTSYIEHLDKGEVTFNKPTWKRNDIEYDIVDDFYRIAKSFPSLTNIEKEKLYYSGDYEFNELEDLLKKNGYSEANAISIKLIELYTKQNRALDEEIQKLINKKQINVASNMLTCMLGMIPSSESADKVLKYERSLQKSIFQNLLMLKKLQGAF